MTIPDTLTSTAIMPQGSAVPAHRSPNALDPWFTVGSVTLRVADPVRMHAFYTEVIGLREVTPASANRVVLGVDNRALVELLHVRDATPPAPGATGLYHLALRVPARRDLALMMRRVAALEVPISGAADHGVSEAVYLDDPEGNGIEIYHDRPFSEWTWGVPGTMIAPLDIEGVMSTITNTDDASDELVTDISRGLPHGTDMGHVHLKVADLPASRAWYREVFGLDITLTVPGDSAAFVAAGGYHHHIGMNVWHSARGAAAPATSTGLDTLTAHVASLEEAAAIASRAAAASSAAAGAPVTTARSGSADPAVHVAPLEVVDPAGNRWLLVPRDRAR